MDIHRERAHRAWRIAERIRKLSDRLIGVGPLGLGLDGVLAWVPVAGPAYSLGAGGVLLYQAGKAGASAATLARMAAYIGADTLMDGVPLVGWALDTVFTGHAFAARALQKDIERRFGRPVEAGEADLVARPLRARWG